MKLAVEESVDSEFERLAIAELNRQAEGAKGMAPMSEFTILLSDEEQRMVGGAKCLCYYGCLYIDLLWVTSELRGQGWGGQILAAAEKAGEERGCTFATLSTMDWEALPFYQRFGYVIEFVRGGYKNESKLFSLRKELQTL